MTAAPGKVLIHRLGSLGDTAIMLPVFHHLNRIWPEAEIRILTNFPVEAAAPPLQAVLGDDIFAAGYFSYPAGTRNTSELGSLAKEIRRWGPDVAIYANEVGTHLKVLRDGVFLKLCGARQIFGLPFTQDRRNHRFDSQTGLFERETSRIARALNALGPISIDEPSGWELCLTPSEKKRAGDIIADWPGANRFLCFSPGTKQAMKDWTDPNWIALFGMISSTLPDLGLAIVGATEDHERSDALSAHWKGPILNCCGLTTPRETAALIAHAQAFLGNDSGPMHLAAAVRTPAIAVFSRHARPGIWFPLGREHRIFYPGLSWSGGNPVIWRDAAGEQDIVSVRPDRVAAACLDLIETA